MLGENLTDLKDPRVGSKTICKLKRRHALQPLDFEGLSLLSIRQGTRFLNAIKCSQICSAQIPPMIALQVLFWEDPRPSLGLLMPRGTRMINNPHPLSTYLGSSQALAQAPAPLQGNLAHQ